MTDRELMQQALEALNRSDYLGWQLNIPIIKALRERLAQPIIVSEIKEDKAQPLQEPVAWVERDGELVWNNREAAIGRNLYTSPPASKPWVPLTDFDIDQIPYSCSHADSRLIAFAIEAKLREKNA